MTALIFPIIILAVLTKKWAWILGGLTLLLVLTWIMCLMKCTTQDPQDMWDDGDGRNDQDGDDD